MSLRKIIWLMTTSVDSYSEGPNHEFDWHIVDDEIFAHLADWLVGTGGFLDDRLTYELFAKYWPSADQDQAASRMIPTNG
jgi:dihydrofolate reductase